MRRFCFLILLVIILLPLRVTHANAQGDVYSSCVFEFEEGMKLSWRSVAAGASLAGFEDVDKFMYSIMCDWRPNSTFLIGGQVKDASGNLQLETLDDGSRRVSVLVDGCKFNMTFNRTEKKFNVSDDKTSCDAPVSHGGVDRLYPLNDGTENYGVSCVDGATTVITLIDGSYCALPKDNRSSKCESATSFSEMASWVCQ